MTKYEYKIIELSLPPELSEAITHSFFGQPLSGDMRRKINEVVEKELNELGKNGWLLHNSGLATLPTLLVHRIKGARSNGR
jgi:hypothetical protein